MARTTTEHMIVVKSANLNGVVRREALADEAITPGHLLSIDTDEEMQLHAASLGVLVGKLVALESQTPDTNTYPTTAAIDIPYAADDLMYYAEGQPGDVFNMFLAVGYTAVMGISQLCSKGDGTLQVATIGTTTTYPNSIVGIADEDVDNSGGGAAVRLRVRII